MLGDKWKALTETERKPYDAKAATDKKRYEEEKAKYNAVSSPPSPQPPWRHHCTNSSSDPNNSFSKPKRRMSLLKRPRRKSDLRSCWRFRVSFR